MCGRLLLRNWAVANGHGGSPSRLRQWVVALVEGGLLSRLHKSEVHVRQWGLSACTYTHVHVHVVEILLELILGPHSHE